MRLRTAAAAVVVVAGAAVCVRLGVWQLDRLHQKRALNADLRRVLALPPVAIAAGARPDSLAGRRVRLAGRYDETRQALLSGRMHEGEPGVDLVTPLALARGGQVLVDRGWIPAPDAVTARPQDYPAPGPREIVGLVEPFPAGREATRARTLEADSIVVVSVARLDRDTLAARLGVALAPFTVRELPGSGRAGPPLPEPPRLHDTFMHLSYAVQWFSFATILLVGSAALAWSRRPRTGSS